MGRLKILHVIGGGEFGGAEQHLLTLAGHLDEKEFEIQAACLFTEPLAVILQERGFRVHVLPMRSKLDPDPVRKLAAVIREEGFHLIHTHGVRANLIGRLAARLAGRAEVVTTVHSVLAFDYRSHLDRWVNTLSERLTRRLTRRFITVSEVLRRHVLAEGIPAQRVVTIHNGLELDKYNPEISAEPIRQELGIIAGQTVLGVVARLHPVKGHTYLLRALGEVLNGMPDLVLVLVGTGPEKSRLERECRQLGIAGRVIFTGFRSDVPRVIAGFDVMVLPSLSEGQGLVILEALAMKKPVLASNVGGVPELVKHGFNGWLVPPADINALANGIRLLAADKQLASRLGEEGRRTVEANFTASVMAEKTAALYKSLIGHQKED